MDSRRSRRAGRVQRGRSLQVYRIRPFSLRLLSPLCSGMLGLPVIQERQERDGQAVTKIDRAREHNPIRLCQVLLSHLGSQYLSGHLTIPTTTRFGRQSPLIQREPMAPTPVARNR